MHSQCMFQYIPAQPSLASLHTQLTSKHTPAYALLYQPPSLIQQALVQCVNVKVWLTGAVFLHLAACLDTKSSIDRLPQNT